MAARIAQLNHETQLLEKEEHYLTTYDNYSSQEIEHYRNAMTLEERIVLMKPFEQRDENDEIITKQAIAKLYRSWPASPEAEERSRRRVLACLDKACEFYMMKMFLGEDTSQGEFAKIRITKSAYKKANAIAKKVVEVSNSPNEIYLHPLDNLEFRENPVIRDFHIPYQDVEPAHCDIKPEKEREDFQEIGEKGKKTVGWAHSHGNFGTWHSNFGTINNKHDDITNLNYIPSTYGIKYEITIGTKLPTAFQVWVAPSLIFNARDANPSKAVAIEYYSFSSYEPKIFINHNPALEIIEDGNAQIGEEEIELDIWKKVSSPDGFKKDFIRKMQQIKLNKNTARPESISKNPENHFIDELKQLSRLERQLQYAEASEELKEIILYLLRGYQELKFQSKQKIEGLEKKLSKE